MSKKNKLTTTHKNKVLSLVAFNMIRKEGKCFDGFVKDEKGNYMFVISKPEYQFTSNQSGNQIDSDIYYTYVILDLQPDGIGCWVWRQRQQHLFFDRKLESSQAAVVKEYGSDVDYMPESSAVEVRDSVTKEITEIFRVFVGEDRKGYVVDENGIKLPNDRTIKTEGGTTIFATSDNSLDASTLYRNLFGTSYVGGDNPKNYAGKDNYDFLPESFFELAAYLHDLGYDKYGAKGTSDALHNTDVLDIDRDLASNAWLAISLGVIHPSKTANNKQILQETFGAFCTWVAFKAISFKKTGERPINEYYKNQNPGNRIPTWSDIRY